MCNARCLVFAVCAVVGILPTWAQEACTSFPYGAPARASLQVIPGIEHLSLEVELDVGQRLVAGRATVDLLLDEPADSLRFAVQHVRVDSVFAGLTGTPTQPVPYRMAGEDSIVVALSPLREAGIEMGDRLRVALAFESRGIRFGEHAAWSLENVEPWFPWTGRIGDRSTSEMTFTVPSGWTVLAPGVQTASRTTEDDRRIYLFASPHELPPHRLGFLAGDFLSDVRFASLAGGRRVPVTTLSHPPLPEAARILEAVSDWTGFAYPFDRFGVLTPLSFMPAAAAGMALAPAGGAADAGTTLSSLIVRQWLGTVVSAADWPHVWIEEGVASYVGALASGADVHRYLQKQKDAYLSEADDYVRPLVWQRWNHPAELYDAHAQAKAAWVAHMLHQKMGGEPFQEAVRQFIQSNQFASVDSEDLLDALDALTEANVAEFANQWIYGAGHPILDVSYEPVDGGLYVRIEQVQQGELVPMAFDLDLTIDVGALGTTERFTVEIDERVEEAVLPFEGRPRFLAVDPDQSLLLDASVDQPASAWIAQLRYAPTASARGAAARALTGVDPDPALLLGLRSALEAETDAAVRAQILGAIAHVGNEAAERALLAAFEDTSAVVRLAVLDVLPELQDRTHSSALAMSAAQRDPSDIVQARAVEALAELEANAAVGIARSALITPSDDGVVRAAGLHALSLLHRQAPGAAFEAATIYSADDQPLRVRRAALRLLGTLAPVNRQAAGHLRGLLASPSYAIRTAAADELARIDAFDVLRERLSTEASGRFAAYLASLLPCE